MRFFLKLLVYAAGLAAASWFLPDIYFIGPSEGNAELNEKVLPLLGVALIMTVINTLVRPVVKVLSFPITVLTLGLFILIINGLMLLLANEVAKALDIGFRVDGIVAAVIGGTILTALSWAVDLVVGDE